MPSPLSWGLILLELLSNESAKCPILAGCEKDRREMVGLNAKGQSARTWEFSFITEWLDLSNFAGTPGAGYLISEILPKQESVAGMPLME